MTINRLLETLADYQITIDDIPNTRGKYISGEIYSDEKVIVLNRRNCDYQQQFTLMHEVIHDWTNIRKGVGLLESEIDRIVEANIEDSVIKKILDYAIQKADRRYDNGE